MRPGRLRLSTCLSGHFLFFFLFGQLKQLLLVFQAHVVDLHIGKRAVLQCLLDRKSGVIGMYVHLYHIVIRHHHDGIADGFQISFEIHLLFDIESLVQKDDKLRAVAEFDLHAGLNVQAAPYALSGSSRLCLGGKIEGLLGGFPRKGIKRTVQDLHQSLSAGIHHACLLQHRKHLRRLAEHVFRMGDDLLQELLHILLAAVGQLSRLHGSALGHGEDRSLLRLHDGLVRRLHRLFAGCGHDRDRDHVIIADPLGKASEKLGKDNAGISPRPAQRAGGDRLGKRCHIRFRHGGHILCRRHDGKRHIRSRISVRYRKHVQLIDPLFFAFKPPGSCQKHLRQAAGVYCLQTHNYCPP